MNIIPKVNRAILNGFKRNIGMSAVVAQKGQASDPVQKLFIQMIKEYDQKAKASPGKLVDASPEIEKELKQELDRITKVYGGQSGADMTKFPTFEFKDPKYDPIDLVQK